MLDLERSTPDSPEALALTEEVQRWYVEIYGGADDDPVEAAEFASPHGGFFVGRVAGEAVAMGGWTRTGGTDAKIRRVYVRSTHRRRGFAEQVLDALEADARAAGATRAVLTTGEPQEAAVAFYRARGYTDIAPFGFYADDESAVHLGRAL